MKTLSNLMLVVRLFPLLACGDGAHVAAPPPVPTAHEKPAPADVTQGTAHHLAAPPRPVVFRDASDARHFAQCSADSQCIAVRNSCCQDRGQLVGVRRDKRREFERRLQCAGVGCSTVAVLHRAPVLPRCDDGMCAVTYGQLDETIDF